MPGRRVTALVVAMLAALVVVATLGACATPVAGDVAGDVGTVPATSPTPTSTATSLPVDPPSVGVDPPPAGRGTPASSQRKTFVPKQIRLLSDRGVAAAVTDVDTGSGGVLELPPDPGEVGFWVGGSLAGELYGSVVLAGHIDSRQQGVGFFARLLDAAPGDRVELVGEGARLVYVVRSNREVGKGVLVTDTNVFDRRTPGRLVLITCTGTFDPKSRHYDRNLVVLADPEGAPTPA